MPEAFKGPDMKLEGIDAPVDLADANVQLPTEKEIEAALKDAMKDIPEIVA